MNSKHPAFHITTAKALHLFRTELESHGFDPEVIDELVRYTGKSLVDSKGLTVDAR